MRCYKLELYHHGIKGMKWGVRRSPEQLARLSGRLSDRNKKLAAQRDEYDKAARAYNAKSAAMQKRNTRYEATITKATAQKAKYDLKMQAQASKRRPNASKLAKYADKSAKYQIKIMKAERKLKHNKWAVKASTMTAKADEARARIEKNEKLQRMYGSTAKAMDEGLIKQGKLFMQYRLDE